MSAEQARNTAPAAPLSLVTDESTDALARAQALVESYRGLADVFHELLAELSLDALLERIADTVRELVPYHELVVYEADDARRQLIPVLVRSQWAEEIVNDPATFGVGITGWAVENREPVHTNAAHLDPRVRIVPGTPAEPEALISVPLVARDVLKGALNIYRVGTDASFDAEEFELAKRFADAAALALDNAQIRARLEHQAQTDGLTGLFNHRYFHERLRAELQRASRLRMPVGVLMLDIDDFKRSNDIHGHAAGDEILVQLAGTLRMSTRGSDVVCRIGGEEFAVIMPATDSARASRLAERIGNHVRAQEFGAAGRLTLSIGLAEGPEHASNPRELVACAETAMMTAKARGKNQIVHFRDGAHERPALQGFEARDARSIAHLKMLQSLSGKLNRLNDVREIGMTIANELRALIDYHNCRVSIVEGNTVVPIAFRGDLAAAGSVTIDALRVKVGEGITGHVVATGEPILAGDAASCEFGRRIPGTQTIDESLLAVPMRYGSRSIGAIVISKLGFDQFDGDDLRLLEVLAGQAAVALENARLYEAQRREAESAHALLEFAAELAGARGLKDVLARTVTQAAHVVDSESVSIWIETPGRDLVLRAFHDSAGPEPADLPELGRELHLTLAGGQAFVLDVQGTGYVVAPIALDDGTRGCVAAAVDQADVGTLERPLRLLGALANHARLALANAINLERLESTFVSTIETLAAALDAGDDESAARARLLAEAALKAAGAHGTGSSHLHPV